MSDKALNALLPPLKKEYEWLKQTYSQVYQSTTRNLSRAFLNFFEKRAAFPRFKSRKSRQSIQYPQSVKIEGNHLKIPFIGLVEAKFHRLFEGEIKTVTISKNPSGKYFASILFEVEGARLLAARVYEGVRNVRQDFLHKLSRKLVDDNQVIVVENLNVKGMVRNHNLAKAISDVGWGIKANHKPTEGAKGFNGGSPSAEESDTIKPVLFTAGVEGSMTEAYSEFLQGRRGRWAVWLPPVSHYGVALLSVILAIGTNLLFSSYMAPTETPPFFVAVMVSAWYGGLGAGLLATVLSTLTIHYWFVEPLYSLSIPNLGTLVRLGIFLMAAILISSLNAAQRVAKRKAEANLKALRESEARFGCLAESNIIGIIVADLNGLILEANDSFLEMVGYTQQELRSGRVHWREMTPPESREASEKVVQELITTGTCKPFEKEYIRKDGSRVPVLHGVAMAGETTVIGFVLDLSERKRAEAAQQEAARRERLLHNKVQAAKDQLETVLASINDQFLVLDHEWRYTYVNDRVEEILGMSKEDLLGHCIWDVFPETVGTQLYKELHRAAAEQCIFHVEYFYPPGQRWFENHIYPSATGVSILVTEITDRKRAQEILERTNQTLQTLIDACPVAITLFDPQGIVKELSRCGIVQQNASLGGAPKR